jgi:hypothetical protein
MGIAAYALAIPVGYLLFRELAGIISNSGDVANEWIDSLRPGGGSTTHGEVPPAAHPFGGGDGKGALDLLKGFKHFSK